MVPLVTQEPCPRRLLLGQQLTVALLPEIMTACGPNELLHVQLQMPGLTGIQSPCGQQLAQPLLHVGSQPVVQGSTCMGGCSSKLSCSCRDGFLAEVQLFTNL